MNKTTPSRFERFAQAFVHAYWKAVESGRFPMPPDETVPETLEELLAAVTVTTHIEKDCCGHSVYVVTMANEDGDSWRFAFQDNACGWHLVQATASVENDRPRELLDPPYAEWFQPFLDHVIESAHAHDAFDS